MMNFDREYLKKNIGKVLLTEREKKIFDYGFGLTDNIFHTLEETGKIFGVTRERIRQIEAKALDKIKNFKRDKI